MPSEDMVAPARWVMGPPSPTICGSLSTFALAARACMITLIALIGHWVHAYLGGVALAPVPSDKDPMTNDTGKLFNWHPVLMTLAFGVFMVSRAKGQDHSRLSG
jgi:cytochrome b-561